MDAFIISRIDLYCDWINKGKPCACEAIQDRYVNETAQRIKSKNRLQVYIENLAPGWKTVWAYKEDYMLEIIKSLPEKPKTVFDHWVLGKAFGYSDEAIKNFLETKL